MQGAARYRAKSCTTLVERAAQSWWKELHNPGARRCTILVQRAGVKETHGNLQGTAQPWCKELVQRAARCRARSCTTLVQGAAQSRRTERHAWETRRSAGNRPHNAAAVAATGTTSPGRQPCPAPDYSSRRAAERAVLSRAGPGRAGSAALLWHGSSGGRGRQRDRAGPGRAERIRAEPGRAAPRCRPAGFRVPSARSRGVSCGVGVREGAVGEGGAVLPSAGANPFWFVSSRFAYNITHT